jgi:hypothetical protein
VTSPVPSETQNSAGTASFQRLGVRLGAACRTATTCFWRDPGEQAKPQEFCDANEITVDMSPNSKVPP